MQSFIFTQIFIFLYLINFTFIATGFPVHRLDGPNDQEAEIITTTTQHKELTDVHPIQIAGSIRVFGIDININIPVGLLIRVAGGCFGLLIIAVLALYIRYCNKNVRDLREAEEELRCLRVVVQGDKIERPQEDTKEKDDTPTKEIENEKKEVSVPTIKAEPLN
ncbi:hypothetical protein XELAEV_18008830mg [Xenopus laevis]|uniref:Uncharacterized protein n=1 Tax=Xenopus laevis TaxID=8355 RepID=A0A974DRK8_XENLA|nr:hypothetical protein XELAEV_18008830mg [Xenopus laevis]